MIRLNYPVAWLSINVDSYQLTSNCAIILSADVISLINVYKQQLLITMAAYWLVYTVTYRQEPVELGMKNIERLL